MSHATEITDEMFFALYDALGLFGACDAAGGAEYERVLSEYRALQQPPEDPIEIARFIRKQANALPGA